MPTVEVARRGPRPPIRLRRAPQFDPPFDDELSPEVWAPARQLAFDLPMAGAGTFAAEGPAGGPVGGPAGGRGWHGGQARGADVLPTRGESRAAGAATSSPGRDGVQVLLPRTAAVASGDARLAVRRFVNIYVEVLNGYRPAAHLRRMSVSNEAARIVAQAVAGAHRVGELRRAARPPGRRAWRPSPVAVLRVRLCEPRPGAVEAAVLLVNGDRTWAMALRLELHQQAWSATTLQLV